jgi:hypothetical protein
MQAITGCAILVLACATAGCSTAELALENPALAGASVMNNASTSIANNATDANVAYFEAQQVAAAKAAVHDGDDQLACEQLQAESNDLSSDPKVKAASAAIQAQQQQRGKQVGAATALNMATGAAGAVASASSPGAQGAAVLGQSASILAQTAAMTSGSTGVRADMDVVIANSARQQRVFGLAKAKDCAFIRRPGQ